jgi:hypothetical protein
MAAFPQQGLATRPRIHGARRSSAKERRMKPYMYVEYPKCLYKKSKGAEPLTMTVETAKEEEQAAKAGWKTAAQFHGYETPKAEGSKDA